MPDAPRLFRAPPPPPSDAWCTYFTCSACETRWPAKVAVAGCGCEARQSAIAVRLAMCPRCNEPPARFSARVTFTSERMGVPRICGADAPPTPAQSCIVEMTDFLPQEPQDD